MQYVALLQIYSFFWYCTWSLVIPIALDYKKFVFLISVSSTICILKLIIKKNTILMTTLKIVFIMSFVALLYCCTQFFYTYTVGEYNSYFLVLIAQTLPAMFLGSLVSREESIVLKIKQLTPWLAVIFTFICMVAVLSPNTYTGGGGLTTDFGLNYQNTSYLASYASNLALYYIFFREDVVSKEDRYGKWIKVVFIIIFFLDLFEMLAAGGRGAVFSFIVTNLILVLIQIRRSSISLGTVVKYTLGIPFSIFAIYLLIHFTSTSSIGSFGFNRIRQFFESGASSGRDAIYLQAITIFKTRPLIGHGLGSIFYELGYYAHNIVLDALVEGGIFGALVLFLFIIIAFIRGWRLVRIDNSEVLWLIFMIEGFMMSIFSGYYLAQIPLYWGMAFLLTRHFRNDRVENCK